MGETREKNTWGSAFVIWQREESQGVFWACVLAGIVIGISAFDAAYTDSEHMAAIVVPYAGRCVEAVIIILAGTIVARILARTVLIGAVNLNLHYAGLLSQGVKWMEIVLTIAMALDHLSIGGAIVASAFGILFRGLVLTLALSIGLARPDLILNSFGQQDRSQAASQNDESVRHF